VYKTPGRSCRRTTGDQAAPAFQEALRQIAEALLDQNILSMVFALILFFGIFNE